MGIGPYIGDCRPTDTYQVFGACSDQNSEEKNKTIRHGEESPRPKKKQTPASKSQPRAN